MKNRQANKKALLKLFSTSLAIVFILIGCSKESGDTEVNLSYKMLADKNWFLQYTESTIGTKVTTKSYVGQTTYFINFLANKSTTDSDGLKGTYTVKKMNSQLKIMVAISTNGGTISNYAYDVVSLGDKNMVLSFSNGTTKTKYFYSINK